MYQACFSLVSYIRRACLEHNRVSDCLCTCCCLLKAFGQFFRRGGNPVEFQQDLCLVFINGLRPGLPDDIFRPERNMVATHRFVQCSCPDTPVFVQGAHSPGRFFRRVENRDVVFMKDANTMIFPAEKGRDHERFVIFFRHLQQRVHGDLRILQEFLLTDVDIGFQIRIEEAHESGIHDAVDNDSVNLFRFEQLPGDLLGESRHIDMEGEINGIFRARMPR